MSADQIRYDLLTQDAMRQMVRHVMSGVARDGKLPGDHHFFITFLTKYRGVRLSPRLREQCPEEMTIILQHQFGNLQVNPTGFEVSLHFSGTPERLTVPFDAITQFFDPSVNFALKFEVMKGDAAENETAPTSGKPEFSTVPLAPKSEQRTKRPGNPKGAGSEPPTLPARDGAKSSDTRTDNAKPAVSENKSADVVSLDNFRKK